MSEKMVKYEQTSRQPGATSNCRPLLPALVAFSGVVSTPALGLELGAASIESALGQPLRASIAYALNPGESLQDLCIYLRRGSGGIPAVTNARLSLRNDRILVTGKMPISEPLISLNLSIECPNTPQLSREYTLFVDPVSRVVPEPVAVVPAQPTAQPMPATTVSRSSPVSESPVTAPAPRRAAVTNNSDDPIAQGSQYRVRVGDTLSTIAARVAGRPAGVWNTVRLLFDANPDAFYGNDVDRLKAGSLLTIPFLSGQASAGRMVPEAVAQASPAPKVASLDEFEALADVEAAPQPQAAVMVTTETVPEVIAPVADLELSATTSPIENAAPQVEAAPNTVLAVEEVNPFVAPADNAVRNGDSAVSVTGGELRVAADENAGLSWWPILTGAAVGVFIALGLFGRSVLRRFRPGRGAAIHTPEFDPSLTTSGFVPERRKNRQTNRASGPQEKESQDEFKARLESASDELKKKSSNAKADKQVLVENEKNDELQFEADSSLESKDSDNETTLNDEVDFELLQQDYEAELTATQALRLADTQAAFDALESLDHNSADDIDGESIEAQRPAGPEDETVEMPAVREDEISIDESLIAEIDTALLEGLEDEAADINETDATMKLPADKIPQRRRKKVSNG